MIVAPLPLPDHVAAALAATAARRGPFGGVVHYHREIASTNDEAARLAAEGAPEGTLVLAETQTAGRGRLGRTWFSPPGAGLYFSVVCRERRLAPTMTLVAGVAVALAVREATGLAAEIKWPNDLVVGRGAADAIGRKLAGILAEASSSQPGSGYLVLGIGVNLRPAAYPPDIAGRATSIETELGSAVDAGALLAACLASLNEQIAAVRAGETAAILRTWTRLAPSASGAPVEWTGPSGAMHGTTAGIDSDGALLVRVGNERIERIVSGEVRWS